jgi:hypothetical protein
MWKLIADFEEQLEGKPDAGLKESLYQVKSGLNAIQQYMSACAVHEDRSKERL